MSIAEKSARLKCPNCGLEYGVAGLAAIGVEDGEERPCSFECEKALSRNGGLSEDE